MDTGELEWGMHTPRPSTQDLELVGPPMEVHELFAHLFENGKPIPTSRKLPCLVHCEAESPAPSPE